MKKICLTAIALMLTMCLMTSAALAVDTSILRVDEETAENGGSFQIRSIVTVGDAAYLLVGNYDNPYAPEIRRWKPGMEDAEAYLGGILFVGYFDTMESAEITVKDMELDADPIHGISQLFTDGERLMAYNHLNGLIFAIAEQDGKPVYEDVVTVKDPAVTYHVSEDYSYFVNPQMTACVGGKLLWLYSDWDEESSESFRRVLSFDLKDGSVSTVALEYPVYVIAYKDGKALVLDRDEKNAYDRERNTYRPWDLMLYDPAADKLEKVAEMSDGDNYWRPEYLIYSESMDALIYDRGTRVMGLFNQFKDEKQVGYLPMSYVSTGAMLGNHLVVTGNSEYGVLIRELSADFKADVYVNVYNGYMDRASRAFADDYPQIPVYSVTSANTDAVTLDLLMNAGPDAPDIMQLGMGRSSFARMAEKGYCADLSGYPKLAAFVADLYPVYRDAVTGPNGEIYAIPVSAYSSDGFFVNKEVMEAMGLTLDDIPTNLVDLCAFCTRWNDEFVDEYPNFTVMDCVSDYRSGMFDLIYNRYIAYCQANGLEIRFDTPVFREMIAAMEAMEIGDLNDSLKTTNPEVSEYKQPLIWRGNMLVGRWGEFMSESSDIIFIPMGLTKDIGYNTAVELEVIFLNPKSQHKDAAVKLMEYMIDYIYDTDLYTLLSTKTEPVENEYYAEWLENEQNWIAELEENLANAPDEEKADWQTQLDGERAWFERYEPTMRYNLHPETIAAYREIILPYVFVASPSFMSTSDEATAKAFTSLTSQYKDGKINIDRFISEMDGKLMMMQME